MTHALRAACSLALLGLAGSSAALAGDKYVLTISPSKVMRFDGTNGALLDPSYCDIDGLLGLGGAIHDMREGVFLGNGELIVANWTLRAMHRFSADGSTYLGDIATAGQPPTWMAVANGRLWVIEGGARLAQYDLTTYAFLGVTQMSPGSGDVYLYNGELLVTACGGCPIRRVDPASGNIIGNFATPPGIPRQMTALASGNLLVVRAYYPGPGYYEYTPTGSLVADTDLNIGQPEGISELGNGHYIISTLQGIQSWDPVALTSIVLHGAFGTGIFDGPGRSFGTNYCTANANSTGSIGALVGTGSDVVVANDFHLAASTLPNNVFGYLLTSRMQGFVQNPAGSAGNLCLGGSIGRFIQQIQNTGTAGGFTIQADLTAFPSPTGNVAVAAGETWSFQAWHRDAVAGAATSNLTVGLEVLFR
jgi:hypothetical protein